MQPHGTYHDHVGTDRYRSPHRVDSDAGIYLAQSAEGGSSRITYNNTYRYVLCTYVTAVT